MNLSNPALFLSTAPAPPNQSNTSNKEDTELFVRLLNLFCSTAMKHIHCTWLMKECWWPLTTSFATFQRTNDITMCHLSLFNIPAQIVKRRLRWLSPNARRPEGELIRVLLMPLQTRSWQRPKEESQDLSASVRYFTPWRGSAEWATLALDTSPNHL